MSDLRPSWIAFGWFIGAAFTALALLALTRFGFVRPDTDAEPLWVSLSLIAGFGLGGIFVGARVRAAPILHGLGIGLFSLLAWIGLNLFLGEPTGMTAWDTLRFSTTLWLLLLQTLASIAGVWLGVRWGRP